MHDFLHHSFADSNLVPVHLEKLEFSDCTNAEPQLDVVGFQYGAMQVKSSAAWAVS